MSTDEHTTDDTADADAPTDDQLDALADRVIKRMEERGDIDADGLVARSSRRGILKALGAGALGAGVVGGATDDVAADLSTDGDAMAVGGTLDVDDSYHIAGQWYWGPLSARPASPSADQAVWTVTDAGTASQPKIRHTRWNGSQWSEPGQQFPAVDAEEINNVLTVSPGVDIADINDHLSTAGNAVWFMGGDFALDDRVTFSADHTAVWVAADATVKIADGASPTTITDKENKERTPVFYADGKQRVNLRVDGEINGNNTNHTRGTGWIIKGGDDHTVYVNRITDAKSGAWAVDWDGGEIERQRLDNTGVTYNSVSLVLEGVHTAEIGLLYGKNVTDVLDDQGKNKNYEVERVVGEDLRDEQELVDITSARGSVFHSLYAIGSVKNGVNLTPKNAGDTLTDRASNINPDGLTFKSIEGEFSEQIFVNTTGTTTFQNIRIHINATTTGGNGVDLGPNSAGDIDGLVVTGKIESTDGTTVPLNLGGVDTQSEDVTVDVVCIGGDQAAVFQGIDDLSGEVKAMDASSNNVRIESGSASCEDIDLTVTSRDSGNRGVLLTGSGTNTGEIRGSSVGNAGNDVEVAQGTDVAFRGDWGTVVDSGVRTILNGQFLTPPTQDFGGTNGDISIPAVKTDRITMRLDAGGSAVTVDGSAPPFTRDGVQLLVKHTGGEGVTLNDEGKGGNAFLMADNASLTLDANGESVLFEYDAQSYNWRELARNLQ